MKALKRLVLLLLVSVFCLGFASPVIYAQSSLPTLAERIAARKAENNVRLTTAQSTRLKARCKAAQAMINRYGTAVEAVSSARVAFHDKVAGHLNKVIKKVGSSADTTELKAAVEAFTQKADAFEASVTVYKQSISDLKDMDCVTDPTGFRALLDSAKKQRATLFTDAKALRAYIGDTIKPLLKTLRAQLAAGRGDEE